MKKFILNLLRRLFVAYKATKSVTNHTLEFIETKGYDSDTCFYIASKSVANKPNILKKRREKLLLYIILRELRRRHVYYGDGVELSVEIIKSYIERGFVYFVDLGISTDSLFSFLELGRITPKMYQELKNVHARWRGAFDEGEDRKQELQRQIYDVLMSKQDDFFFFSLHRAWFQDHFSPRFGGD